MARKLKKSVINSIPHLSENLNEEEKQRKLKQSVVESIPHLSENLNNENYKRSLKQSAWDSDSNFDTKRYDDDEDIAPVRDDRTWFQDSEGNWWETILGSQKDLKENVTSGIVGIGEKIVDAGRTLGAILVEGQLMQSAQDQMLYNALTGKEDDNVLERYMGIAEENKKEAAEFVAKDLYDEKEVAKKIINARSPIENVLGIDSEKHSIFGAKSDDLAVSAGQLGAQIGVDLLLPGSGTVLMGATTFGSEAESAFQNGATFDEAVLSATVSTTAEILTEKIGGVKFGGKTLTDAVFGKLANKVTGKFAKALVAAGKIGADASAEAVEEIVSGYVSAWGQKLTYMDDKEINELFSTEDALESAIGGFVLGGGFSVGEAAVSGRNPVTGLNKNEQAVVDKVVNDTIAEKETNGKKLTDKEKSKIRESVVDKMEKGQIDIDTIESVLGGDTYKAYKETVDSEDALKNELAELRKMKSGDMNDLQTSRMNELKEMNLDDTTKRDGLRKNLDDMLSPMLKDSKLSESYRERERRGQAFEADLSKYTGKKREAVERAVKSGVLNNTYRSHELVDVLSEIEATKGISFDYTNNEKLKESGFAVEGKTVNGFASKSKGAVTLNVQSAKAWESVVGHEITHVLEGTDAYSELRNVLYAYAESKGELEGRRAYLNELYQNMDADVEAELTADLVGDYLFTDKDFVSKLTGNRTLFQKIYDEIKYLWNVATGKEKTEIEKVKAEFDRVWKEYSKNNETIEESSESREYGDVGLDKFGFDEKGQVKDTDVQILDGGTAVKYSLSTWTPETQDKVRNNLVKAGYETERVDKWIDDLNGVASVIAADKDRLDFEAADNQVMLKNNQEYIKTLDASTLCAKRLAYQGTFDAIQHRLPNTVLTSDDLIELQNMLKEHGYEAPCSVCYVESRRRHLGKFAQEWLDGYEGEYKPNLDEVTTSDGLEKLRHSQPQTYKDFVDAMNAKGSANPKVVQLRTEYRNDIMKLTKKQVEKIEAIGGLRVQSFSDFETPHLLDMMQAVMDMSAKGLTSQAYTKVPNFAWVFGDTGIKINLSLIAEGNGFDSDGNLAFSSVEGMDINEAMAVRDAYSENVGTIIVGANDAHILACMADDRIDYIIPFHRSGWGKNEMDMMGLGSYEDYSYGQNEHDIETGKKVANLYPPDYWDYNVSGKENAERYLKLCAQTGREPKFSNFLVNNGDGSYSLQPDGSTDGYWKTLIDFKMYDNEGNGAKQRKVQPNFNMEEAYRILNEYEGGANSLPVANDVVEKFVAMHTDDIAPTPDVQYSISAETDADYMSAVERGDTETAQMMVDEAAKNAGYTRTLYHGTASKFNVFGFGRTGIFTTDNFDMAKTYGNNVMSLYGKEGANVLHIDAKESPHWAIEVSKDVLDFSEYPLMRGKERYSTNDISLIAFREGYDVVVIDNVYDNYSAASGNTENGLGTDVVYKDSNQVKSSEPVTYDDNGNVIPLSQRFNAENEDIRYSLSKEGEESAPVGTPFRELALNKDIESVFGNIAPVGEGVSEAPMQTDADGHPLPDDISDEETVPLPESSEDIVKTVKERLNAKITNSTKQLEETKLLRDWVKASYENKIAKLQEKYDSKKNKETKVAVGIKRRIANLKRLAADLDTDLSKRISDIEERISKTAERMEEPPKKDILEVRYERINNQLEADKAALAEEYAKRKEEAEKALADKPSYFKNKALALYEEVRGMQKGVRVSKELGYLLDNLDLSDAHKAESYKRLRQALIDIKNRPSQTVNQYSEIESIAREMINASYENDVYALDEQYQAEVEKLEADAEQQREHVRKDAERVRRKEVYGKKVDEIKAGFASKGVDFDTILKTARRMHNIAINDTTPQRVNDKTFGYEAGEILNDFTFNRVALNESKSTEWQNEQVEKVIGASKKYRIKPGSKESAAAQMYAEGFYVNDADEYVAYGDAELAKDFPDAKVRNNIIAASKDPAFREIYDTSLDMANVVRVRNGYEPIPRRQNYYMHYREEGDFFSKHGIPFNPSDIKAKDLPTDINGRTVDLKPGQPYFANANQRKGHKTTYDLFGGVERYIHAIAPQIFHIDDIQTERALWWYLADNFGQANGLENLDSMTPEEQAEHIKKVFDGHLSNYARFLNEHANHLAGKTALMDRATESILGRRGLEVINTINSQAGKAQVGGNVSSAMSNILPMIDAIARTPKQDSIKAFAQMTANIFHKDGFAENDPALIRRKGVNKFNKTMWEKATDVGFMPMQLTDNFASEFIVRTKYNQLTREGMGSEEAHIRAGEWAMRIMGDRSLGQMPLLYNSKTLGLLTKYQLEVRNTLDSRFYDTIQEEKASTKDIEDGLKKNAVTAAKITNKVLQTAVLSHMFGLAYEQITGYNPAFDIISVFIKLFGLDDDDESEDTFGDNIEQGLSELLGDLPYTSLVTGGGKIPMSDALPISKLVTNTDDYGQPIGDGSWGWLTGRAKTIGDALPYYLPFGYGQIKKTAAGLNMFSDDHPVSGSYTDSGSLRFPVEDTPLNRVQAALFGQYASKNAREYFDNGYAPLSEKQIQEYIDVDMPIKEYREYREGLKKQETLEDKFDYISGLDLPVAKKNILINNVVDRKEAVDLEGYEDFGSLEEFDFATKNPEKYAFAKSVGGYSAYQTYSDALYDIKADKDASGKSINGSRKEKVLDYINNLDADYYTKIILWKSEYPSDDNYNREIVDYINNRSDLSYEDKVSVLAELGFRVTADGQIYAD